MDLSKMREETATPCPKDLSGGDRQGLSSLTAMEMNKPPFNLPSLCSDPRAKRFNTPTKMTPPLPYPLPLMDGAPMAQKPLEMIHHEPPRMEQPAGFLPTRPGSSLLRLIDFHLNEWIGHRVLVKRQQFYWPGVIKAIFDGDRVAILVDGEETPMVIDNIFSPRDRSRVVSDVVPSTSQVRPFQL